MSKKIQPMLPQSLKVKLEPLHFKFIATNEIKTIHAAVGQKRAIEALDFGIGIQSQGYNIFAMGPPGIGKRFLINKILARQAKKKPTPNDWCYIYNFENPQKPIALSLPKGMGFRFHQDMKTLVDELVGNIVTIFESDEYQQELEKINKRLEGSQKNNVGKTTLSRSLLKKKHERIKLLQQRLTKMVILSPIKKFKTKYSKFKKILNYINTVQKDILENVHNLVKHDETTNLLNFSLENISLTKYKVNLFVDNRFLQGAPIIYEDNPTYTNLICRIEHVSEQGNFATNFTLIRPGSLHLANHGYLIIDARKLKKNQEAWEALKSALYIHQIRIRDIEHTADNIKPISLEPAPIPLSVKVILIGNRNHYYSLCHKDDDFLELFKVAVDFDEVIARNSKNIEAYSKLIGSIITQKKLLPFHASAIGEIIEYSSRLAEDKEKLSAQISLIKDLCIEANYYAKKSLKKIVRAADIRHAIASQVYRMDRSRELYLEDIKRGFIIIKTEGKALGQVNCLSVRRIGSYYYGHPTRVTARVYFGKSKFIDIQREIKLAGPLHSKAGLIISNFLAARYFKGPLLGFTASISFEQIYCWTDGDSASLGELCALLSAMANIPLYQHLAVTGSIDQFGKVQAVGGINHKIEGFFDACFAKGLNGKQGVIIPAINEKNIILRHDILEAIKNNQFFIYPIKSIDEAILLLTGYQAGKRRKDGNFPEDSFNYYVEDYLRRSSQGRK